MLCNVVYAHLTAGMGHEARDAFDAELYAPAGGWEAAEAQVYAAMSEAVNAMQAEEGDG